MKPSSRGNRMTESHSSPTAVLLSVAQAAQSLGIAKSTLRAYIRAKAVKSVRIGRRTLIAPAELERVAKRGLPSVIEAA